MQFGIKKNDPYTVFILNKTLQTNGFYSRASVFLALKRWLEKSKSTTSSLSNKSKNNFKNQKGPLSL